MTITQSLRRARKVSNATLAQVAAASGVREPNLSTIERGLRHPTTATAERVGDALGLKFVAVRALGRSSAAEVSAAIALARASGDARLAYRQLIQLADDLAAVDPATRVVLTAEEPERVGDRWDDAVAALVEYRLAEVRAPLPTWVSQRTGDPEHPWEPERAREPLPFAVEPDLVPEAFRKRGVLIEESELVSA